MLSLWGLWMSLIVHRVGCMWAGTELGLLLLIPQGRAIVPKGAYCGPETLQRIKGLIQFSTKQLVLIKGEVSNSGLDLLRKA